MTSAPSTHSDLPAQTELVIGLVGPVGIDLGSVFGALARVLTRFEYTCVELHLSRQLKELDWDAELSDGPEDERIWSYMDAGNRLRSAWERDDAFALLAVNAVTRARRRKTGDEDAPASRTAYVLRSLKRKEEADLLRKVYGDRFVLISLYAPEDVRCERLENRIANSRVYPTPTTPTYTARELVVRDAAEAADHGQSVRGVFHEGDFFVDAWRDDLDDQLSRTMEVLFGHPNRTPSRAEEGMFFASAAARRSSELGRQVGAALCSKDGSLIAVGTNDVPRAGGGLYWEGDPGDAREFTRGQDTSDARKSEIAEVIVKQIEGEGVVDPDALETIAEILSRSKIDDLIEFVRAVHAEMAVITDAVRRGLSVQDAVLFVTTFPCHHCARHVVAAGISRVVYVAPYPKSLAEDLHSDALVVDPRSEDHAGRVAFEPFVGVGPRRYLTLFSMPPRKDRTTGEAHVFNPVTAVPRISEIEPEELVPEVLAYIRRERRAIEVLERVMRAAPPRFEGFPFLDASETDTVES